MKNSLSTPAPICDLRRLIAIRRNLSRVVLAGGAFDIFHSGHVTHLRRAKARGRTLIVHVVGNKRVREKKGPGRPIFDERDRAQMIAALRFVDYVFIYNGRHYDQNILTALQPDVLFFHEEAFTPGIKNKVAACKEFRGITVVDRRKKKQNHSSRILATIHALSRGS